MIFLFRWFVADDDLPHNILIGNGTSFFFCRIWRCCQQFRVLESSHQICGRSIRSILRRGIKSRADSNERFKGTRMLIFHRTDGPLFETPRHWIYETHSRKGNFPLFKLALRNIRQKIQKKAQSLLQKGQIKFWKWNSLLIYLYTNLQKGVLIEKTMWNLNLWKQAFLVELLHN